MAGLSSAIDIDEIAAGLPRRIHEVMADYVDKTPGQIALVEDGMAWSYGDLDRRVTEIANVLSSLGVRAGDRMLNSIKPRLTSYIRPPKIVVVAVLPGRSTDKTREHELAQCWRGDRVAARQPVKLQRRTHLT
ncbi:AMP-binding protein [Bradyrhizobium archetypum]|uniref:AMP-dependent synthetase/ligase domain-containing protein n=1 Tax=Bradyrhizobium archetypum TaxID=2721160 RepID=A0A7Y4H0G8_9BRAD|nr:AMP-binding protein [Bradyrhizobium archetypum]NOJ45339.1 hypothetical protein [Bradyrhizobium archetypum]